MKEYVEVTRLEFSSEVWDLLALQSAFYSVDLQSLSDTLNILGAQCGPYIATTVS